MLSNIYQINNIEVSKGIFKINSLTVELSLKEKVGVWCGDSAKKSDSESGVCFKFDIEGFLFEQGESRDNFTIKDFRKTSAQVGDYPIEDSFLKAIVTTKEMIDFLQVFQYDYFFIPEYSVGEFWIKTTEGWDVFIDKDVDLDTQIIALKKLLEEKIGIEKRDKLEYVDLRINDRMYYKLK